MKITLANIHGAVIVQTEDGKEIAFGADEGDAPPTAQPKEQEGDDSRPRPLILGPKTKPPLPTNLHLTRVVGRTRRDGTRPFVIRLDEDVQKNNLTQNVSERLARAIAESPGVLQLDVYIPPLCSIDVDLLTSRIASAEPSLRSITLRVGSELEGD